MFILSRVQKQTYLWINVYLWLTKKCESFVSQMTKATKMRNSFNQDMYSFFPANHKKDVCYISSWNFSFTWVRQSPMIPDNFKKLKVNQWIIEYFHADWLKPPLYIRWTLEKLYTRCGYSVLYFLRSSKQFV